MLRLEWIPTSVRLERRTTNMVDPHSQLDCAALKSQSQRAHEFTYGTEQVDTGGRANGRRHCAREAAATLHSSAKGRDEHAPWVRLHLAPWNSRKLAPLVGASLSTAPSQRQTHTCRCLVLVVSTVHSSAKKTAGPV